MPSLCCRDRRRRSRPWSPRVSPRDDGFRFVGYLPRRAVDLRTAWDAWRHCGGLVVAFETGHRLAVSLARLATLAPDAPGAVCRELTKVHEEIARGPLSELALRFAGEVKGEITLVVDTGGPAGDDELAGERAHAAAAALRGAGLSRRDAAAALAVCLGVRHNEAKRLVDEVTPEA